MRTAVEHLRKFAQEREAQRQGRDTRLREGEAEREQIEPRVERMAALCLRKAEGLAKATGMSIPVWLSNSSGATTASFRLRAGTYCSLVARLAENGWDVKTYLRREEPSFNYPTDQEFEKAHEQLLESVLSGLSVASRPDAQTATAALAAKPAEATREDQPRLPDAEQRDTSLGGTWNRAQFELSLRSIGSVGFSPRVMEYFRERARATGRLPHELVIEIVEEQIHRATKGT